MATLSAVVSGGRIKCRWQVKYTADEDDADSQKELEEKGYTLPEYAFVVECDGATSGESGVLEVRGWIRTQFKDKRTGNPIRNCKYTVYLLDGRKLEGFTDKDGFVELQRLEKGSYFIELDGV